MHVNDEARAQHGIRVAVIAIRSHTGHSSVEDGEGADGAVVVCAVVHFVVVLRAGSPGATPSSSSSSNYFLLMQYRTSMGS
jgi:hypothetical protein